MTSSVDLERFAKLLHRHGSFDTVEMACAQVTKDHPKGYPSDKMVRLALDAENKGNLVSTSWDRKTGCYHVLTEKNSS